MKRFLLCVLGCLLLCGGLVFASDHKVRNADTRDQDNNANNVVQPYHDNGDTTFSPYVVTIPGGNSSTTVVTATQFIKVVATAGTPVLLESSQHLVESLEVHARKTATTANTGNVVIGFSSTGGQNYRVLQPGESYTFGPVAGKKWDTHTIYVDAATNADAVVVTTKN